MAGSMAKALEGRVAIVTGGSRGIGRAIAQCLAEDGASVVVSGLDPARLEAATKELEGFGAPVLGVVADVARREDVERLVDQTKGRFARIDVLVNNAGITRDALLVRMKDEDWDRVLDVNLRGAFLMTRAGAKVMMRQKGGRIINMTSLPPPILHRPAPRLSRRGAGGSARPDPPRQNRQWARGRRGGTLFGRGRSGVHHRPGAARQRRSVYVRSRDPLDTVTLGGD